MYNIYIYIYIYVAKAYDEMLEEDFKLLDESGRKNCGHWYSRDKSDWNEELYRHE
jgi:hypothetical protein